MQTSKQAAEKMASAVNKREVREAMTLGLYTIKRRRKVYSVPFVAPSDDIALHTIIEASHDEPTLQGAVLFRIGDFCLSDGVLKSYRNPKIITK